MKLKKGIIFITANVVNKRILCVFSIVLFIMSSHAQVKELSMELELLNVSRSNIHPSPQGGIIGDTVPVSLTFEFLMYNHTHKPVLFGSNTKHYYRPAWDSSDYGEIGRFLMINKSDTIALFTYYGSLIPNNRRDTIAYWATIEGVEDSEDYPVFRPFLHHWSSVGKDWVRQLYNYLKECRFVYVPIQADYQRRLDEFADKSMIDSIVYPRDIIEIKKKDPFDIIISDSEEEYYIYPPIFIKQDE
ncbi:hypothetical protein [Bacteroides thetaiotaomicron]|uniref:hypothetical protein n=1 Tax=Bacteroides thetaiotaomicron TaxID=818 RepID=UPI0021664ED4|nr:hypothetical protein [Bacteroides thetaiotaomicron]MCS3198515.1 hypothetical protein [Bacteroides thetaiotaomicron]